MPPAEGGARARQHTLQKACSVAGTGLHTGAPSVARILPADEDTGFVFVRDDVPSAPPIPATLAHVVDTTLATTLGISYGGARITVGTVEHLLGALVGLGFDNARIHVDGPEVSVLDGSAQPWAVALLGAGRRRQRGVRRYLTLRREVVVRDGPKWARIAPAAALSLEAALDFDHPCIGRSARAYTQSPEAFLRELAPARTFGFRAQVAALQARGLARGGSLKNAVVLDDHAVLNPEGLRFSDEFVRHKLLDALGDLALLGRPLLGRVRLHQSGHALHAALVKAVLEDAHNVVLAPADAEALAPAACHRHAALGARERVGPP